MGGGAAQRRENEHKDESSDGKDCAEAMCYDIGDFFGKGILRGLGVGLGVGDHFVVNPV